MSSYVEFECQGSTTYVMSSIIRINDVVRKLCNVIFLVKSVKSKLMCMSFVISKLIPWCQGSNVWCRHKVDLLLDVIQVDSFTSRVNFVMSSVSRFCDVDGQLRGHLRVDYDAKDLLRDVITKVKRTIDLETWYTSILCISTRCVRKQMRRAS